MVTFRRLENRGNGRQFHDIAIGFRETSLYQVKGSILAVQGSILVAHSSVLIKWGFDLAV